MGKPTRTFEARVGQKSVGPAGPDQLKHDLDNLFAALNPDLKFKDGSTGGIGPENIRGDASFTEAFLAAITLNQTATPVDSGKYADILNGIVSVIRSLKGTADWKDPAATSLAYLLTNKSDKGHSHGDSVDGHTHFEFASLDIFGVARQVGTNMTITRDSNDRFSEINYNTNDDETGVVRFHRDNANQLDCARFSNNLGTQLQIELLRDPRGFITGLHRGGFNELLQSGAIWPII